MVLLRFTKFINKVMDHSKVQTIRRPRKNPIKLGNQLQVYVLVKIGEATVTAIKRKKLCEITEEEALADGFASLERCRLGLIEMHNLKSLDEEFDIIYFYPSWEKKRIDKLHV